MTSFSELLIIDNNLRTFLNKIEKYFSIKIDEKIIEKIFNDAEDDQISKKEYIIFQSKGTPFKKGLTIIGSVGEYEPETILIGIQNIDQTSHKYFTALASDIKFFGRIL